MLATVLANCVQLFFPITISTISFVIFEVSVSLPHLFDIPKIKIILFFQAFPAKLTPELPSTEKFPSFLKI